MKRSILLLFSLLAICNFSCEDDDYVSGVVIVQNKVSNVRIEDISFSGRTIAYSLLPGQTSGKVSIEDYEEYFPKTSQIEFRMESKGNTVYLMTRKHYELNPGDTLNIVISDTTEVYNPMNE